MREGKRDNIRERREGEKEREKEKEIENVKKTLSQYKKK